MFCEFYKAKASIEIIIVSWWLRGGIWPHVHMMFRFVSTDPVLDAVLVMRFTIAGFSLAFVSHTFETILLCVHIKI